MAMCTEILRINEENEVRIPHIHHGPRNIADTGYHNRALHHARDAHLALNEVNRVNRLNNVTGAKTAVSAERDILFSLAACEPCCDAPRAVAGELCFAAIGVEEAKKELSVRFAVEKLDA